MENTEKENFSSIQNVFRFLERRYVSECPGDFICHAVESHRNLPVLNRKCDVKFFEEEFKRNLPAVRSYQVSNVVITHSGHAKKNGFYISRQFPNGNLLSRNLRLHAKNLLLSLGPVENITIQNTVLVTNDFSIGFFHFIFDVCMKLELLESLNARCNKNNVVIIPETVNAEYVKFLSGLFNLRFFFQKRNQTIMTENLTIIPDLTPSGNYRNEILHKFRRRVLSIVPNQSERFEKVYITRKNSKKRRLLNEKCIEQMLVDYDFKIYDFDNMPFDEQVRIVKHAKVLASLHGAALSHMVWMSLGSDVIELRDENDTHNNCYYTLASELNHKYHYVLLKNSDPSKSVQSADFLVDPVNFEQVLSRF